VERLRTSGECFHRYKEFVSCGKYELIDLVGVPSLIRNAIIYNMSGDVRSIVFTRNLQMKFGVNPVSHVKRRPQNEGV
jgi:hypothetical protein